jgi:hypothetical protein
VSLNDRTLERGLVRLERLISWAAEHEPEFERNEAATRFDLIDRLLLDVLGWPREQVRPEERSRSGYADYVLGRPRRQLVVEAKREGRSFRLPPETPQRAALSTLFALDSDLSSVVEQAKRYADDFGLPYAAVMNGRQLVAFLAVRLDGVEPLKGKALAFASLEAMRDGFADLWDGLSRPGVEARRLSAMLGREGGTAPPPKPSVYIPGYPGQAPSDSLMTDLRMLGELFLIDLVEHPAVSDEFLRECYLSSGALSQHASVGKQVLQARYSRALEEELEIEIAAARTKRGVPEALLSDLATASLSARPIILLGYVGVGKTMFVRHLVRIEAKDVLAGAIVLYVNLGTEPALEQLEPFIADHFIASLDSDYGIKIFDRDFAREVYAKEINDFHRGPWGELAEQQPEQYRLEQVRHLAGLMEDRAAHLRRSLEFLAVTRKRQIVTVLDNVDQRPAQVQDRVFLIAETMAKSWPGTVFVALRPDTFNRSKRTGTLKAYQPRVFAVSPPRIDRLLEKRIMFAKRQIAKRDSVVSGLQSLNNVEALNDFLEVLRLSLRRSRALAELVDNLSGQNAREALALLTTLVSSPHVRPHHVLQRVRQGSHHSIPFHQFLRAVMLGEKARYDPASSRVTNLFDISSDDGREHFLLPIIVSLLRRSAEPGVRQGFVPASRVFSHCQDLGFQAEQVVWHLERGLAGEMIEPSPLDGAPELFRTTTTGSYIEQKLIGDHTYVDEVVIDTPIVDDQTRAVISDAEFTSERMQRTDRFSRYLDDQWQALDGLETGLDWPRHGAAIRAAVADIERRLEGTGVSRRRRRAEPDE